MDVMRVLLVDDHALFRESLRRVLDDEADIEVVGEAGDGKEAMVAVREQRPHVVLMDINLPGMDGIATTAQIRQLAPEATVVMLTVDEDVSRLFEALRAGAEGYLAKNVRSSELIEQLRGVAHGQAAITQAMAGKLLQYFRADGGPGDGAWLLTKREMQILELVTKRLSNREIAAQLVISEYTVKNHMKSIMGKLRAASRRQAVAYARARGLIPAAINDF